MLAQAALRSGARLVRRWRAALADQSLDWVFPAWPAVVRATRAQAFAEPNRVLKPGGQVFFSTPCFQGHCGNCGRPGGAPWMARAHVNRFPTLPQLQQAARDGG